MLYRLPYRGLLYKRLTSDTWPHADTLEKIVVLCEVALTISYVMFLCPIFIVFDHRAILVRGQCLRSTRLVVLLDQSLLKSST